jgi:hypothetical protein
MKEICGVWTVAGFGEGRGSDMNTDVPVSTGWISAEQKAWPSLNELGLSMLYRDSEPRAHGE